MSSRYSYVVSLMMALEATSLLSSPPPTNFYFEGGEPCKNDFSGRSICNRELSECRWFHGFSGQSTCKNALILCISETTIGLYPNHPVAEACGFKIKYNNNKHIFHSASYLLFLKSLINNHSSISAYLLNLEDLSLLIGQRTISITCFRPMAAKNACFNVQAEFKEECDCNTTAYGDASARSQQLVVVLTCVMGTEIVVPNFVMYLSALKIICVGYSFSVTLFLFSNMMIYVSGYNYLMNICLSTIVLRCRQCEPIPSVRSQCRHSPQLYHLDPSTGSPLVRDFLKGLMIYGDVFQIISS